MLEVCKVPLSIKMYHKDEIVCDVVDTNICHILLGRSWHYDVDATYKGQDNTFVFWWFDKKIVLMPQSQSSENNSVTKKDKSLFTNITNLDFFKQIKELHARPPNEFSLQPQNSRMSFLQVEGNDAAHDHH